jgi:ABC-type uncharacterized transport system auxiliary subunit
MATMSKQLVALLALGVVLAGCQKKEEPGPAEQMGRKLDQATQQAQEAAKDTSEKINKAASQAGEELNKATEVAGKKIEEAGEKIQQKAREARDKEEADKAAK